MGDGVIGYILRTDFSAKINLSESDKIVDYAMFNSQLIESAQGIAEAMGINGAEQVIVSGTMLKLSVKSLAIPKLVFLSKTKACPKSVQPLFLKHFSESS